MKLAAKEDICLALPTSRVTGIVEFLPNARLFTLGSCLKISEVARIFLGYFSHDKSFILIL
jgi:hypothetical protein